MGSPNRHANNGTARGGRAVTRRCRARTPFFHAARVLLVSWVITSLSAGAAFATCGSGATEYLVPDNPLNFRFSDACVTHDKCYDTCGRDKSICDLQFYANMQAACEPIRKLGRYYKQKAQALVDNAAQRSYLNIPGRLADLSKAGVYAGEAARLAARWLACRHLARTYFVAVDQAGRGPYCSSQKNRRCCPVPAICTSYYSCPAVIPGGGKSARSDAAPVADLARAPSEIQADGVADPDLEKIDCPPCQEVASRLRTARAQYRAARQRTEGLQRDLQGVQKEYETAKYVHEAAQHDPEGLARFLSTHPDAKDRYSKEEVEDLLSEIDELKRMIDEAHEEAKKKANDVLSIKQDLESCNRECETRIRAKCPRCQEVADALRGLIKELRALDLDINLHEDMSKQISELRKRSLLPEEADRIEQYEDIIFPRLTSLERELSSDKTVDKSLSEYLVSEDYEKLSMEEKYSFLLAWKRKRLKARIKDLYEKLKKCDRECDDLVIGADGREWCRYGGGEVVIPGESPPPGEREKKPSPKEQAPAKEREPTAEGAPPGPSAEEMGALPHGRMPEPDYSRHFKRFYLGPFTPLRRVESVSDEHAGSVERQAEEGEQKPEVMVPAPGMTVVKATQEAVEKGRRVRKPVKDAVVRLGFRPPPLPPDDAAPHDGSKARDDLWVGFNSGDWEEDPIQGVTDENGEVVLRAPQGNAPPVVDLDLTPPKSMIIYLPRGRPAPKNLAPFVQSRGRVPGSNQDYAVLFYPEHKDRQLQGRLAGYVKTQQITKFEENLCRDKQEAGHIETASPDDPYFRSRGSWGQDYPDQWAIQRVRIPQAWEKLRGKELQPVVVAVIDTGIDWSHPDLPASALWRNPGEIPDNGIDDDGNGYVDDIIGWDFYHQTNLPWDYDGHGTFTAGVIAAGINNGFGMAGINPAARVMILKALNDFGHTRASFIAQAIQYAVDNGARIINLSVGGKGVTEIERAAIAYAQQHGVLVVAAAGNEALDVADYGIAGLDGVLTVAATGTDDRRAFFSNWGARVDVAAPGVDVLSLRARRTDLLRDIKGIRYEPGHAYVGREKFLYRASGTSFAAPIVTGIASLLVSARPELTAAQVGRMIIQSARDVDVEGIDQYTGYGLVDAEAALDADPDFFITARISGVRVASENGNLALEVLGLADADRFEAARIEIGAGEEPARWEASTWKAQRVAGAPDLLARLPADAFRRAPVWTLRLIVRHRAGRVRESRFILRLE